MSTSAIVIGGSMAGLAAARVLNDRVDRVTILERDRLEDSPEQRRGVPQGRHAHAVLAAGERLLDGWFPGLVADLEARGAMRASGADGWWHQGGAYRVRADLGITAIALSRPLLETTVRQHLLRRAGVTIVDGAPIDELMLGDGRVTGVVTDGLERPADLVVDCTGRHSHFVDHLEHAGYPAPPVSQVKIDMAYGTRVLRRRDGDIDGPFAVLVGPPQGTHRIGVMLPMEDDRWIITLGGFHGDVPPTDEAGFADFARTLPAPLLADVLDLAEPLSPIMSHRMPTSQRRHFERLDRRPEGYVALGDAICSFNPIYGQGMSSAARQAEALGRVVDRAGVGSAAMVRGFYRRAARVVDTPWTIAAGADFADPRTSGTRPTGTRTVNRYLARVMLACHTSPRVARQMTLVQNLVARPQSLMTPAMMARVLRAARRSPAVTGTPAAEPVVGPAHATA